MVRYRAVAGATGRLPFEQFATAHVDADIRLAQ